MKVIYEFDGKDEYDRDERKIFEKATDYYIALHDIDEFCRSKLKYFEGLTDREDEWLTEIRKMAWMDD
jgi:hypothetical protein